MKRMLIIFACAAGLLVGAPALAQGVSEASGIVKDREGNPIQGAVVTFFAQSKPEVKYSAKSNKKGRYFVAGMFSAVAREMWRASIEVDGFVAVEVRVESRTVNKVLVGDVMEAKLSPGKSVPEFPIPPLGKAQVDWIAISASAAEQEFAAQSVAVPVDALGATEGGEPAAGVEPAEDPWVEALTLANNGSLEASVELFDKAMEDAPDDAERREVYAKVLYRLERGEEAEVQALQALEIDPARIDSTMILYSIYERRGELVAAKGVLEAAGELAPNDSRILDRLAYVALEMGDTEAALAAYQSWAEADPRNPEVWVMLANVFADLGRLPESQKAYQRVVDLDPENAYQTYYNLGALILKRDDRSDADFRRAIDAFRRAVEIKPDYMLACQELAFALIGIGDQAGAREALQGCVTNNPDAPEAATMKALIANLKG